MNAVSATSAWLIHCPASSSQTAVGYLIGVHASWGIWLIARLTVGQAGIVNENHAAALSAACTFFAVQNAESARTQTCAPGVRIAAAWVRARLRCQCAPLPERVAPRRSEHSATTGALVGVLLASTPGEP